MALDKTFQPGTLEPKIYQRWEQAGAFAADPTSTAKPYTIMMPPPNVTGSLHIGHALTFTLQDILVRHRRSQGFDVLWQPGTDHAGIATQMVVERRLEAAGESRGGLGREEFNRRVWAWKAQSGDTITRQLRRLGASPDWARERFTLDDGMSRAVSAVFVRLYNDRRGPGGRGLIYRDKRLINWDPKLQTAVSDLEVDQRTVKGHMWHFRYPLEHDPAQFICIATTRPETMLGDGAVAVNPDDDRYRHLVGRRALLPLTGRLIPIIADRHADPDKGSGAVKITAAHDFNDFEVWQRHRDRDYFTAQQDGGLINLFDEHARLNHNAPEAYRGLDRFEARRRIVADLDALGLVETIEPISHAVPHGDRSGVVLEPRLSTQWYADAAFLADKAIAAVEDGTIQFAPSQWANTYFAWMRNIQPWCISRQLWWGHQIPAWYDGDGRVYVAHDEAEAIDQAGPGVVLTRDPDVLDTWFSSALFPFSTLGWPDDTDALKRYYPTDVLVTGFDIIFFWVARMIMMGLYVTEEVPFSTVAIHGLVRDALGQKMSKSKGNVTDPLELIDRYGADALRFTMAALASPGRDVKLSEPRLEGYRNFATKLWNAARFAEMNGCRWDPEFDPADERLQPLNRWIVGAVKALGDAVDADLDAFRFDEAANRLYRFVWGNFCDWYIEFAKPIVQNAEHPHRGEARDALAWTLRLILLRLHPFMPFITEELWDHFGFGDGVLLGRSVLPELKLKKEGDLIGLTDTTIELLEKTRSVRAELGIAQHASIAVFLIREAGRDDPLYNTIDANRAAIWNLTRLEGFELVSSAPAGTVPVTHGPYTLYLGVGALIDIAAERPRLTKALAALDHDIARLDAKLKNDGFRAKADPDVIDKSQADHDEAVLARDRLASVLAALG